MTIQTTNLMEVLINNLTDTTSKNDSKLESKIKYIYKCHIGTLNRLIANMEPEYETGSAMLLEIIDDDYDLDAKGGYGRGAYERSTGFGFPNDFDKLDNYLGELRVRIEQMTGYRDIEQENFETKWGMLTFKNGNSTNKLTDKQKAKLKEKYAKA